MRATLFVTCLVDQVWPEVGLATAALLRHAGCEVVFDEEQTCCGQPNVRAAIASARARHEASSANSDG